MKNRLNEIVNDVINKLAETTDENSLKNLRSAVMGKKSELNDLMLSLKDILPEERPVIGKLINEKKAELNELFTNKIEELKRLALEKRLSSKNIDVTLPGLKVPSGSNHLLKNVIEDFEKIGRASCRERV